MKDRTASEDVLGYEVRVLQVSVNEGNQIQNNRGTIRGNRGYGEENSFMQKNDKGRDICKEIGRKIV